jgi:hypothetical protein
LISGFQWLLRKPNQTPQITADSKLIAEHGQGKLCPTLHGVRHHSMIDGSIISCILKMQTSNQKTEELFIGGIRKMYYAAASQAIHFASLIV